MNLPVGLTDTKMVPCSFCRGTIIDVPEADFRDDAAYYCGSNCRGWAMQLENDYATYEEPRVALYYKNHVADMKEIERIAQNIESNLTREKGAKQ